MTRPILKQVVEMAKEITHRRMAERELLTAQFILTNPDVPIEDILMIEQFTPHGVTFTVREKSKWEKLDGKCK